MIFYWLVLVGILITGVKFNGGGLYKTHTTAVNGFFIGWVFLRHACDYIPNMSLMLGDNSWHCVEFCAGQLIVATFLFFSGYGVMESIQNKGVGYVHDFPRKRILKVWLDFNIAILLFLLVGLLVGKKYSLLTIALSMIGWDDVGNSNWYIFVILLCYFVTWVVYSVSEVDIGRKNVFVLVACAVCGLVLFHFKEFNWWDTILAYPAGMIYSQHKQRLSDVFSKHSVMSIVVLVTALVCGRVLAKLVGLGCPLRVLFLNIRTIAFALIVVWAMGKVSLRSRILDWMGSHLFPIYIYQRLAFIIISSVLGDSFVGNHRLMFFSSSVVLTMFLALAYTKWICVRIK